MRKKILVTGSAGFIGFHLAKKLLARGDQVIGVDNLNNYYDVKLKQARNKILLADKNYKFYKIDLKNFSGLKKIFKSHKIDKIVNLAAQAGVRYSLIKPFVYEESNLKGFLNILESARQFKIKDLVYASSSSVYGGNKMSKNGFKETDAVNQPISLYAASKRANELMAYTYQHLYGLNCTGLRFFTVYGPWGRPDMALATFAEAMAKNKSINVYNYGKMRRDFTYVDDIVDGVIKAIDKPFKYEIFNLGNSQTVELKHFVDLMEKEMGMTAKKKYLPLQPGDVLETFANVTKAKKMLGFNPRTKIETTVKKSIEWYKEYYKI